MPVKKLTPLLFVEKIEPVLPFWQQHLGFIKIAEVPDGEHLAFVILQQGSVEVMYQTYANVEQRLPAISADIRKGPSFLLSKSMTLSPSKPLCMACRVHARTRHVLRLREIGIKDPAGHFTPLPISSTSPTCGASRPPLPDLDS